MSNYKRQFREVSDETKQKIQASTTGKKKSITHRQHISQAMINYWQHVPHKPTKDGITMDELIGT